MANTVLGYKNRIDKGVVTGPVWVLPLINLQDPIIGRVTRSVDLDPSNTWFDVDLQTTYNTRVFAIAGHNFSPDATFRVRLSNDPLFEENIVYDSGLIDVWPAISTTESLEFEDDNFWFGQVSIEQREAFTKTRTLVLPAAVNHQYARVEINDTANPDGYIQIGRVFIGEGWQPRINFIAGAGIGWETDTKTFKALSGALYFDRKSPRRVAAFAFDWLSEEEAYGKAFDIVRSMGIDGEVMFIYNPEDTIHALSRQFLGHFRKLDPIRAAAIPGVFLNAHEIEELI